MGTTTLPLIVDTAVVVTGVASFATDDDDDEDEVATEVPLALSLLVEADAFDDLVNTVVSGAMKNTLESVSPVATATEETGNRSVR